MSTSGFDSRLSALISGESLSLSSAARNRSRVLSHPKNMPNDHVAAPGESTEQTAVFGGGCFWCLEAVFSRLEGVKSVTSGYMGGRTENPTYQQVCGGATGHAEVVQVKFDPRQAHYRELLEVFFATHDPTTLNRQGNDVGTQYRSAVFYENEEQKHEAERAIMDLTAAKVWHDPVVTSVEPMGKFYPAEDYHQSYYVNNSSQPYCRFVIEPKLQKFRKKFAEKVRA
jgi:peptide-methionine (S)-S-oxide reductase